MISPWDTWLFEYSVYNWSKALDKYNAIKGRGYKISDWRETK